MTVMARGDESDGGRTIEEFITSKEMKGKRAQEEEEEEAEATAEKNDENASRRSCTVFIIFRNSG